MRLVCENSAEDVAKVNALASLRWPLNEFAANFIRVVRGAGSPQYLPDQLSSVLKQVGRFYDAAGRYPSGHEIGRMLSIRNEAQDDDWDIGLNKIIQGALQCAASDLAHQHLQRARGEDEILAGMKIIEEFRLAQQNKGLRPFSERHKRGKEND